MEFVIECLIYRKVKTKIYLVSAVSCLALEIMPVLKVVMLEENACIKDIKIRILFFSDSFIFLDI